MTPPVREYATDQSHALRDIVVGALVLVVAGCIAVFANIPTRTSVLETRVDSIEKGIITQLTDIQTRLPRGR
ncbi:MAG: hypothetical protein V4510_13540 [bacterium]